MVFALLSRPKCPKASPKFQDKRRSASGQRTIVPHSEFGGGAQRLYDTAPIQTKLEIGEPNEKFEQEADRVADKVMRTSETGIQMKPT